MADINPVVIDISHHNYDDHGPYDFDAARRWGVHGVIAKATEDIDYEDPTYRTARDGARRAGLLFGCYHFFRPSNVEAQVRFFLETAWEGDPERETLLLCLDHEDDQCSVDDVKEFLRLVEERTGQRPVLYSGHLIKDQLEGRRDSYLGATRLWLAQYGTEPEVQPSWDTYWLWQYTGDGEGPQPHDVPGIGSEVDISSWPGTYVELEAQWTGGAEVPDVPDVPDDGEVPPWLQTMRAITGLTETPGGADNPKIMFMADYVGQRWPEQKAYSKQYTGDDVAWCGLTVAFCVSTANIEPVFGDIDTERWMWALAWSEWPESQHLDEPVLGCIVVMTREGGGHVTLYEGRDGNNILCRGGNQSDQVKVSSYDPDTVVAYVWPTGHSVPSVELNATELAWVQAGLNLLDDAGLDLDGEMGPMTEGALKEFQRRVGLTPTGKPNFPTRTVMLQELQQWNIKRSGG